MVFFLILSKFRTIFFPTQTFDVSGIKINNVDLPPFLKRNVITISRCGISISDLIVFADLDQGQRDSVCQCHLVLQGARTHICPPTQNLDISL